MNKWMMSAAEAVSDIPSGASLAVGGFGVCGVPARHPDRATFGGGQFAAPPRVENTAHHRSPRPAV